MSQPNHAPPRLKRMLSYAEAEWEYGISERWLRLAVEAGLLVPAKLGTRRSFRRESLEALIELAEREGIESLSGATAEPEPPRRKPRRPRPKVAA